MKNISTFRVFRCYKTYDGLKDIEKRRCSSADNWDWSWVGRCIYVNVYVQFFGFLFGRKYTKPLTLHRPTIKIVC